MSKHRSKLLGDLRPLHTYRRFRLQTLEEERAWECVLQTSQSQIERSQMQTSGGSFTPFEYHMSKSVTLKTFETAFIDHTTKEHEEAHLVLDEGLRYLRTERERTMIELRCWKDF